MRITGGKAKNIPLKVPATSLRPSTDFAREALFSHLGAPPNRCYVLDAFAGTGAYGLEALSRGAAHVTFVENNPRAIATIKTNLEEVARSIKNKPNAHFHAFTSAILPLNLLRQKPKEAEPFDWIFVAPPWPLLKQKMHSIVSALLPLLNNKNHAKLALESPSNLAHPTFEAFQLKHFLKRKSQQSSFAIYAPLPPPTSKIPR